MSSILFSNTPLSLSRNIFFLNEQTCDDVFVIFLSFSPRPRTKLLYRRFIVVIIVYSRRHGHNENKKKYSKYFCIFLLFCWSSSSYNNSFTPLIAQHRIVDHSYHETQNNLDGLQLTYIIIISISRPSPRRRSRLRNKTKQKIIRDKHHTNRESLAIFIRPNVV